MHTQPSLRSYNLFGESTALPDVIHCERIETRSLLHDWHFKPHRHGGLHQIFLIQQGGGRFELDNRQQRVVPNQLINIPKGVVHGFRFESRTEGWVVTLTSELIDQIVPPGEGLDQPLSRAKQVAAPQEAALLMARIFDEYEQQGFARAQILRGQAAVLLGLTARALAKAQDRAGKRTEMSLMRHFENAVEESFAQRPSVAHLAAQLAVSPTHLSRVTRAVTGKPASQILAERVSREARRLLVFTNLSVSEISYALGYQDPAHFSKAFKGWTGQAPKAFRMRSQNE